MIQRNTVLKKYVNKPNTNILIILIPNTNKLIIKTGFIQRLQRSKQNT